jgi:dTDP-4-amino-4,6-dideoxygalactose transaminase
MTIMLIRKSWPKWPHFAEDEIAAVTEILKSGRVNYWTGKNCTLFEKEFAEYVGTKHAVALMNGTVALESILYALNIGEGDDVIVTPRTFIASASCIVAHGANPVMVDVDPDSQNITAETIKTALTSKTKAIICVHFSGWPCDMDPILKLAKEHNLYVIEDCAQAHGATYKGRKVGSIGDAAAFSFCQDKIMSTGGEGGMVTTSNEELWNKIWSYKDHGKSYEMTRNKEYLPEPPLSYHSFGTNLRMTEMQAVIGRLQLKKLSQWLQIRRQNASFLHNEFKKISGVRAVMIGHEIEHSYYNYYAFVESGKLNNDWNRNRIATEINQAGVFCKAGCNGEIYLEKAFVDRGWGMQNRLPVARQLAETSLLFLVHPALTIENMRYTSAVVKDVMERACKH